ncbi:MAG TPA: M23 family metallopeptidase [Longimicrobiales bacterium]|nr:M23 family metallopeptidase [Longimicrobiales bacterium]
MSDARESGNRGITVLIIPDGDLETRTFEISYGKLKLMMWGGGALAVMLALVFGTWFVVASQAARVPALEREVNRLEAERSQVTELARRVEEAEAAYERVRQMLGADAAEPGADPILPPLEEQGDANAPADEVSMAPAEWPLARIGYVTQTANLDGQGHPGVDIAVPSQSYIRATATGTVVAAERDSIYGLYVLLEHGGGIASMYGHASELFVEPGDAVEQGEVIALSGSTGRSTAPHLHFEIRKDGVPVDPTGYIRQP